MTAAGPLRAWCPAKVNLGLRVVGTRPDGYHELRTVFQAIDLWDVLEARAASGIVLRCDDPSIPTDERNLVVRAAEALREALGDPDLGAAMVLRKRIPAGGGLGGGSADAAGALVLLSRLWGRTPGATRAARHALGPTDLRALAASLGSDVPFFLTGGTALGLGRGERLRALPFAGTRPLLLGLPPFGTSTAEVFARYRRALTAPTRGVSLPRLSPGNWRKGNDFTSVGNDLEAVVLERWPELGAFRDALLETGAGQALVSGSGSTVFGVFEDDTSVHAAAGVLEAAFTTWKLVITRAIRDAVHVEEGGLPHEHHPGSGLSGRGGQAQGVRVHHPR